MSQVIQQAQQIVPARQFGIAFRSQESLAALRQTAMMFSLSSFVKANELRGGGDFAVNNAMILCEMAQDFNVPVYSLLNSVYFIHGTPAFTSQFFISRFNMTGLFSRISYEMSGKGEDFGCIASCVELSTKQKLEGSRVTMRMAHESRWSPIWDKLPEQMLRYRSATFLIRSVAPEVMLGFHTVDEQKDIANAEGLKEEPFQQQVREAPKSTELVIEPKKPTLEEQFQQLCIFGQYDCEKILSFTIEAYSKKGISKTPEECMQLFVSNPELLERAHKKLSQPQQVSPVSPVGRAVEEAPKVSADKGASKTQPSSKKDEKKEATSNTACSQPLPLPKKLEEFEAYIRAGHKIVASIQAEQGDPYGVETRVYISFDNGGFNTEVFRLEWNNNQQQWNFVECFKTLKETLEFLQQLDWNLIDENTPRPY